MKSPNFRRQEHGATIVAFKNNVYSPLRQRVWKFPFDITYQPAVRVYRRGVFINRDGRFLHKYCRHPRSPNRTPSEIFEHVYSVFRRSGRSGKKKPSTYMLFDYLHDFRVWANYLDIDNLLNLWGQGLKAFMDQNLSLILFFIGGISELCFLAIAGYRRYRQRLQRVYDLVATSSEEIAESFHSTPLFQRFVIYKMLGMVRGNLHLREHQDPNRVVIEGMQP